MFNCLLNDGHLLEILQFCNNRWNYPGDCHNIFDKQIKNVYNKNRNESHRQCVLPIWIDYTTQLGKAKCGVFLYLFVSPHYVYNTQQGDIYGYWKH
jgi:hypothetical protein